MQKTPPASPQRLAPPQTSPLDRARQAFRFFQPVAPAAGTSSSSEAAREAQERQPSESTKAGTPRQNTELDRRAGAATENEPPTPHDLAQAVMQELRQDRQDRQEEMQIMLQSAIRDRQAMQLMTREAMESIQEASRQDRHALQQTIQQLLQQLTQQAVEHKMAAASTQAQQGEQLHEMQQLAAQQVAVQQQIQQDMQLLQQAQQQTQQMIQQLTQQAHEHKVATEATQEQQAEHLQEMQEVQRAVQSDLQCVQSDLQSLQQPTAQLYTKHEIEHLRTAAEQSFADITSQVETVQLGLEDLATAYRAQVTDLLQPTQPFPQGRFASAKSLHNIQQDIRSIKALKGPALQRFSALTSQVQTLHQRLDTLQDSLRAITGADQAPCTLAELLGWHTETVKAFDDRLSGVEQEVFEEEADTCGEDAELDKEQESDTCGEDEEPDAEQEVFKEEPDTSGEDEEPDTWGDDVLEDDLPEQEERQPLHKRLAALEEQVEQLKCAHAEQLQEQAEQSERAYAKKIQEHVNLLESAHAALAAQVEQLESAHATELQELQEQMEQLKRAHAAQLQDLEQKRREEQAELSEQLESAHAKKLQEQMEQLKCDLEQKRREEHAALSQGRQEFQASIEQQLSMLKLVADAAQQVQAEHQRQLESEARRSEQVWNLASQHRELAIQHREFERTHKTEVQGLELKWKRTQDKLDALQQQVEGATEVQGLEQQLKRTQDELQGLEQQLKRTHNEVHALAQQVEGTVQPPFCRLPGCWQPVHKENGLFYDYCGRAHARQDGAIDGAIQDDVDQPTLRLEVQKLKGTDTLIQNPELAAVSRQQLFGNTPVKRASTTPPGYQGGRGGQLTQEPTRRQPTYRTTPRQFQHEDQRIRGNEYGMRTPPAKFPFEEEKMKGNDGWSSHPSRTH